MGRSVFTWKDFHDLGTRRSINHALARLAQNGKLRRVARGLYDMPRESRLLRSPAPASIDAVIDAIRRRDNVNIRPDSLAAANAYGLTTAVLSRPLYLTSGGRRNIRVGNRIIQLRPVDGMLAFWLGSPAAPLVQALMWMRERNMLHDQSSLAKLRDRSSDDVRDALAKDIDRLPRWAMAVVRKIVSDEAMAGPSMHPRPGRRRALVRRQG